MLLRSFLALLGALVVLTGAIAHAAPTVIGNGQDTFYPRLIRLAANGAANGRLIAAFDYDGLHSPVYESVDDGATWTQVGTISISSPDTFHCCSGLYEMPVAIGGTPKGALLWGTTTRSGTNDWKLRIYISTDIGRTWTLLSTPIAAPDPIWEPEFNIDSSGRLVMYYSSEAYKAQNYNQLLAHRISTDGGVAWGPDVFDVAIADGAKRPGMPTVRKLPNGAYVMVYEICGYDCDTFIRTSSTGVDWGDPTHIGTRIESTAGNHFSHAPVVSWANDGTANGKLIVIGQVLERNSDNAIAENNGRTFMFNTNNGTGAWTEGATPLVTPSDGSNPCTNYSSQMLPSTNGATVIQMANADCRMNIAAGPLVNPVADGVYRIIAKHSGQTLDVNGCSASAGANVQQWPWIGGDCQRWKLTNLGNGDYTITSQVSGHSLDVAGCAAFPGANIQQWTVNGADCQKWKFEPVGGGWYRIVSKQSNLVLDVNACSGSNGANVQQWNWVDNDCQRWKLERVSANKVADGSYAVLAKHSGQALDVAGCSASSGANIQQWPSNGANCQIWHVALKADGFYELSPRSSLSQRLDLVDGSLRNGANIRQWPSNNLDPQRWSIEKLDAGYVRFVNKRTDKPLDVAGCSTSNGANAHQWDWNGADCQRWQMNVVP